MLLTIDVGNTNISFRVFKGDKIVRRFNIPTYSYNCKKLRSVLSKFKPEDAVICSVVPWATKSLAKDLAKILGKKPYIIGKDIKVPIKNCYSKPKEVGQDRLVNAYAGVRLYGAPLIVIDFGTGITFDVISKNREYLGGMILPGLGLSLNALSCGTALLPKIRLSAPRELIGRSTKNSMLSGVVYGFSALTDELVMKIKQKIGRTAKVVGTGGDLAFISKYAKCISKVNNDLTLIGLYLIWQYNYIKKS